MSGVPSLGGLPKWRHVSEKHRLRLHWLHRVRVRHVSYLVPDRLIARHELALPQRHLLLVDVDDARLGDTLGQNFIVLRLLVRHEFLILRAKLHRIALLILW